MCIRDSDNEEATVTISFSGGTPPYTFVYMVDGISQDAITTSSLICVSPDATIEAIAPASAQVPSG